MMMADLPTDEASVDEHDTLKYSLLGPSLTKSGQDNVDQQKVRILDAFALIANRVRSPRSSTMLPKVLNSSTTKKLETRTSRRRSTAFWQRRHNSKSLT